ncbi:hypothetical protein BGX33_003594 [Mortierella sp. NVP41]|nr:hypothetical protein BGX33_003594 [Mortierella sp. NVP41]
MGNVKLEPTPQHADSSHNQHRQRQEQVPYHRRPQQQQHQDEEMAGTWANAQGWASTSSRDRASENMLFKFGTDMPTTIDLQSAIDCCDMLCRFALQFASQTAGDSHGMYIPPPRPVGDEQAETLERTNLQAIRNLSSTMLIGLQYSGRGTDGASGSGIEDPLLQTAIDRDLVHEGDERGPRFGPGPVSNEMSHELAKSAAAIFQLAIRIKAWVNMTPAERVLDEEINIIRGKRCLFMDGTTTIPMQTLDLQHHHQHAKDWALAYTQAQTTLQGFHGQVGQDQFERDYSKQDHRHSSQSSSRAFSSSLAEPGISTVGHKSIGKSISGGHSGGGAGFKSEGAEKVESPPHQKYRKRAKRTHPPGRCLSCDSSDTPEWRRGPDGARTLCNACGLHYAKLLKRQQQQRLQGRDPDQIQLQIPMFSQRTLSASSSSSKTTALASTTSAERETAKDTEMEVEVE